MSCDCRLKSACSGAARLHSRCLLPGLLESHRSRQQDAGGHPDRSILSQRRSRWLDTVIARASETEETSVFANLTFHLGEKTEVSAGARYIEFDSASTLVVTGNTLSDISSTEKPTVWNLAGSHRFTDDFMLYAQHRHVLARWTHRRRCVPSGDSAHHAVHGPGLGRLHVL